MTAIERLFQAADNALIANSLINTETLSVVKDEYDGYLAGFGPSVIISGLVQTIAVYTATPERACVLNAIAEVANIDGSTTGTDLLSLCITHHNERDQINLWREDIINASVALKIMIRTYNINR